MQARRVAMLGAGLLAAAGCGDDCKEGTTRCFNNTVEVCLGGLGAEGAPASPPHWSLESTCAQSTCIQPPGLYAMCVGSTDPDPLCATANSYCSGDAFVGCASGYSSEPQACGARSGDPAFTKCVSADPQNAVCVPPQAMPNDACPAAGTVGATTATSTCAGTLEIECLAGLAIAARACADCAGQCIGFLGDICGWDGNCATGFTCQPDSTRTLRCTAACDPTDPNAAKQCEDLFAGGGLPPSAGDFPLGATQMTCNAGFCEWMK